MNAEKKVAIVYHYFAHYRRPVLELLCADGMPASYSLISDQRSNLPSLSVIVPGEPAGEKLKQKWQLVENRWLFDRFLWQKGLLQHLLAEPFDAVIFLGNAYFLSTWVGALVARLKGAKVYMWTHGVLKPESGAKGLIRKCFYRLADGILLYGHRAKQLLIQQGFAQSRLHVIYNSLDYAQQQLAMADLSPDRIRQVRAELQFSDSDRVIIATARLTKEKQFDLLLRAAQLLIRENPSYKLLIIGDGPYLGGLRQLAIDLGIPHHVVFWGACYEEQEIATFMSLADIAVVPGDVGLSCIHSLTYGIPMITHDRLDKHGPEFEAIIEDETGGFYEFGNIESLAEVIEHWCSKVGAERAAVGNRCKRIVAEHYNPEFQCREINRIVLGADSHAND